MDKGIVLWLVFLAIFAAGTLISRSIKRKTEEEGIETEAVVSRIVDDGAQEEIDIDVYVRYRTEDGEEIEGLLSNPRPDMEEGQRGRIKYQPTRKTNSRLI